MVEYDEGEWLDCEFLRHVGRTGCVVRLVSSGAVMQVRLVQPLVDLARACLVMPLKPTPCRIRPSKDPEAEGYELDIEWPRCHASLPPPQRFTRHQSQQGKRQKTN